MQRPGSSRGEPAAPRTPAGRHGSPAPGVIALGERRVEYRVRVSARARHMRLVIRPESGLEVVVPRGVGRPEYERFVREKAAWVVATLDRFARVPAPPPAAPLADGRRLALAGREVTLALREGAAAGRFSARLAGDTLTLTLPSGRADQARRALELWYRRQAAAVFAERLSACNAAYGFRYGRVGIKDQKTRWGSCSRQGNLNFNWRLLLAPPAVLDYVVVHELCHLRELNHGPRFWQLVARGCPDYQAHRRWLRQHGRELVL